MSAPIIQTTSLTKRFRKTRALDGVDLSVNQGSIFAFLGPNGAGKTTTIKLLVDILRPNAGSASLFGVASKKLGRREFERIGYVSENQKLHSWMTVAQLIAYCRPLYPTWSEAFCQELLKQFDLPTDKKIKSLSRGMQMKAALVVSLAYRPELLILDEPFSGLDPVVREDFIDGILDLTQKGDWTIFISSHDIDEVERLADQVAILDKGRIRLDEPADALRARFRRVQVTTAEDLNGVPDGLPHDSLLPRASGRLLEFVDSHHNAATLEPALREAVPGVTDIQSDPMTLKEIYLAFIRGTKKNGTGKH